MASGKFVQSNGIVNALPPKADNFATAGNSDVIRADNCEEIVFAIATGVSVATTPTITVEACDDVTPTNTTAIPFKSQSVLTAGTLGAVTDRLAAGFAMTTATANQYHTIMVDPADVEAANSHEGRKYVRVVVTENEDVPQIASILAIRVGEHFAQDQLRSAIV